LRTSSPHAQVLLDIQGGESLRKTTNFGAMDDERKLSDERVILNVGGIKVKTVRFSQARLQKKRFHNLLGNK
jgi:hypothetical protein